MNGRTFSQNPRKRGKKKKKATTQIQELTSLTLDFSLLKVHLQLRGFTVFIDIEQLRAGKFDERLLQSVRQANSFIIILTPNALDRCLGDDEKKDWVHKVKGCLHWQQFSTKRFANCLQTLLTLKSGVRSWVCVS